MGKYNKIVPAGLVLIILILSSTCAMATSSDLKPSDTKISIASNTTGGEAPLNVKFAGLSSGEVSSWQWSVLGPEDLYSSAEQNPVFYLKSAGIYEVELVADGSEPVKTLIVVSDDGKPPINIPAKSDFLVDVTGLKVSFTEMAEGGSAWRWDFGDGSYSSERDPVHVYEQPGAYLTTLAVTGSGDSSDIRTEKVVVDKIKPTTDFASRAVSAKAPLTVAFTDKSGARYLRWNFGDGGTSSIRNPSHVYKRAGKYTVSLVASNQVIKTVNVR